MTNTLETIEDLATVTGGVDWLEALGVTAVTSGLGAGAEIVSARAKTRLYGFHHPIGPAAGRGAIIGAALGLPLGVLWQAARH